MSNSESSSSESPPHRMRHAGLSVHSVSFVSVVPLLPSFNSVSSLPSPPTVLPTVIVRPFALSVPLSSFVRASVSLRAVFTRFARPVLSGPSPSAQLVPCPGSRRLHADTSAELVLNRLLAAIAVMITVAGGVWICRSAPVSLLD